MLPYAGITSLKFKYSNLLKIIVTKLKQRSQSAGNFKHNITIINSIISSINMNESTSETLRNKTDINIKKISIHVPTHLKPMNNEEFNHYLAGLIDGDGHFSKTPQLVIAFNELDASLAYYIKSKLGYGNVYKVKNKKAVILVISKREGIKKVLEFINKKIRNKDKLDQINNNILLNPYFYQLSQFQLNQEENLNNYWLAGFADADSSFQIKIIPICHTQKPVEVTEHKKFEVRLNFQIDKKKNDLLILIKQFLGGNIGYRKNQDTYYYGSTSFGSAKKVINYFDRYHLLSSKYINYLKWRKAYIHIQNKEHLSNTGLEKIINLKSTMNKNNTLAPRTEQDKID